MLNLNSIMVFSDNPEKLSQFYTKIFGKEPDMADSDHYGFKVGNTFFNIGPHDKVKGKNSNPERIIFNFETDDVEGEFSRLKDLGAKVIAKPYRMGEEMEGWIATLEDPDGNYFQLMSPWEEM